MQNLYAQTELKSSYAKNWVKIKIARRNDLVL